MIEKKTNKKSTSRKTKPTAKKNENIKKPKQVDRKKTESNKKEKSKVEKPSMDAKLKFEILGIISIVIGVFFIIALQFNAAGSIGVFFSNAIKSLFSETGYILPYCMIAYGILMMLRKVRLLGYKPMILLTGIYVSLLIMISSRHYLDLEAMNFSVEKFKSFAELGKQLEGGGVIGGLLSTILIVSIGEIGAYLFSIALMTICLIILTNKSLGDFLAKIFKGSNFAKKKKAKEKERLTRESDIARDELKKSLILDVPPASIGNDEKQIKIIDYVKEENFSLEPEIEVEKVDNTTLEPIGKEKNKKKKTEPETIPEMKINLTTEPDENYVLPSINLLNKAEKTANGNEREGLVAKAETLERTLENFGVKAKVVQVNKGPSVTRFEIQPNQGVKVSSIVRLSDDIALNLEAPSIRIEAPIPGKAAVGIEIQNDNTSPVIIRDVLESKEFKDKSSKISFAVGKDISGKPEIADIATMPHLLIAGATGSGKSVCINSLLASILYKARPDEVKLLLIDPKVVELNMFNGIPHLLIPVVTDPNKAAAALNWAVNEMTDRYKMFATENVRDLKSYNKKVSVNGTDKLPEIVIVIDELADLMMASPAQVEDAICRLAQMARAAGMHLIVATQRPSVDVITGVIKANIPSRIAFAVASQVDSRTILDMGGAEKLLGKGDMLFYPSGLSKPVRIQGALILDEEIERIIEFVKGQNKEASYSEDIIESIESTSPTAILKNVDDLLKEAIETVVNAEQASVSMIQRKYRVGYNRAARMIDEMEERGIVGPFEGSKPRRVLITKEELEELDF